MKQRGGNEDDVGRELPGAEDLESLGLHVQDGHPALLVDLPDRLQLGAVHRVLMSSLK